MAQEISVSSAAGADRGRVWGEVPDAGRAKDARRAESLLCSTHLEQLERGGMKGPGSDPFHTELPQTGAELLGRPAREGDHEDVERVDARGDHLADSKGEHRGLACPSAGEDGEAMVLGGDRLMLSRSQSRQGSIGSTVGVHDANRSHQR